MFCVEFDDHTRTESTGCSHPLFFGDEFGSFIAMTYYFFPNDGIYRIEPINHATIDRTV